MQHAVCVQTKKKNRKKQTRKNPGEPKTNHEIHSSPATATASRRHETKHVPRVSLYSPASIDPGFVEIGLVQTALAIRNNDECYTYTDRQTDTDGPTD